MSQVANATSADTSNPKKTPRYPVMTTTTQTATSDRLFAPLTAENAPERSRPVLASIQKGFGFVPNLMATFANSPTVLEGYLAMDAVWEKGTFSPMRAAIDLPDRQRGKRVPLLHRRPFHRRQGDAPRRPGNRRGHP